MFCTYSIIGGHRWDEGNELHLKTVNAKLANLFKYVRKSTKATENLEEKKGWNSQLTRICSVLEVPEVKLSKLDTVQLTGNERKMHGLRLVLKPFENSTLMVQQERSKF